MSVTIKQVIDAAIAAAEAKPDFVYRGIDHVIDGVTSTTRCMYVEGEKPGCIFGHGFVGAGIPIADVNRVEQFLWEEGSCDTSIGLMLDALMAEDILVSEVDEGTYAAVSNVQQAQDSGRRWGHGEVLAELRQLSSRLA